MDRLVFPCWVCIWACAMKRNSGSWSGLPTAVYILYIRNIATYHIKYKNTEFSVKKINLVVAGDILYSRALEVVCLFLAVPHTPIEVCLDALPYGV